MKIEYKNNKLKKQFGNAFEIKKAFGEMAKKIAVRLSEIVAAPNLAVLIQLPGPKCHALQGERSGEWAVSISPNYRLIFEIDHNPIPLNPDSSVNTKSITDILIIGIDDYH